MELTLSREIKKIYCASTKEYKIESNSILISEGNQIEAQYSVLTDIVK